VTLDRHAASRLAMTSECIDQKQKDSKAAGSRMKVRVNGGKDLA